MIKKEKKSKEKSFQESFRSSERPAARDVTHLKMVASSEVPTVAPFSPFLSPLFTPLFPLFHPFLILLFTPLFFIFFLSFLISLSAHIYPYIFSSHPLSNIFSYSSIPLSLFPSSYLLLLLFLSPSSPLPFVFSKCLTLDRLLAASLLEKTADHK